MLTQGLRKGSYRKRHCLLQRHRLALGPDAGELLLAEGAFAKNQGQRDGQIEHLKVRARVLQERCRLLMIAL